MLCDECCVLCAVCVLCAAGGMLRTEIGVTFLYPTPMGRALLAIPPKRVWGVKQQLKLICVHLAPRHVFGDEDVAE